VKDANIKEWIFIT